MSDKLIRKTFRKMMQCKDYSGICRECNSPISYDGEILAIEIEDTPEKWVAVPVDVFQCPYCQKAICKLVVYKTIEVSAEFSKNV